MHTGLSRLQDTLRSYDLQMQPRPVVSGPFEDIVAAHIFVNAVQYDLESAVRAVEACFKIYFALNASYPPEAKSAWLFIQKAVFGINSSSDGKIPSAVTELWGEISAVILP